MANTKEIQRRIRSIGNTKKITRAMEMVAAAKMRKAIDSVLRTRTYANLSWVTVLNLTRSIDSSSNHHPLLTRRPDVKQAAIVLFASNRGLCGSFNAAILNKVNQSIKKHHFKNGREEIKTEIIVVGRRGLAINARYGYPIAAEFLKADIAYQSAEVASLARLIMDDFLSKKYDKVLVAYTDFVNPSKQIPRIKQLLPIDMDAPDEFLGIVGRDTRVGLDQEFLREKQAKYSRGEKDNFVFTFEPSPREVLDDMLPRLLEIQLFQALLESNASEHSARMSAMRQASDAAGDMIKDLTLYFNKARQASITAEIAEISAGANALVEN